MNKSKRSTRVRILPVPTCEYAGGRGCRTTDLVNISLRTIDEHLKKGWTVVYVLMDSKTQEDAMGGGVVKKINRKTWSETPEKQYIFSGLQQLQSGEKLVLDE